MDFRGVRTFEKTTGNFKFGVWVADQYGDQVPNHGHEDAHFMWAIAGAYETEVSRQISDTSGIVVFNPAATEHKDRFLSPGIFFSLKIFSEELDLAIPSSISLEHTLIRSMFWQICNESAHSNQDTSLIIEGLCYEALSMVGRTETASTLSPRWLNSACEYLRDETDLSITDAARQVGVHPTHFVRAFKNRMKCTPGEFRRFIKLQSAASKMVETNLSIAEVAAEEGYTDQSHFTKHFRRAFGITPGAYLSVVRHRIS